MRTVSTLGSGSLRGTPGSDTFGVTALLVSDGTRCDCAVTGREDERGSGAGARFGSSLPRVATGCGVAETDEDLGLSAGDETFEAIAGDDGFERGTGGDCPMFGCGPLPWAMDDGDDPCQYE